MFRRNKPQDGRDWQAQVDFDLDKGGRRTMLMPHLEFFLFPPDPTGIWNSEFGIRGESVRLDKFSPQPSPKRLFPHSTPEPPGARKSQIQNRKWAYFSPSNGERTPRPGFFMTWV
jgi:hypothetical protein